MNKKNLSIVLVLTGIIQWSFPKFNGVFFEQVEVSVGEGHIIGIIAIVGGLLLWYLPQEK